MLGKAFSRLQLHTRKRAGQHSGKARTLALARKFAFESLDERTVLSAMSFACQPDEPVAEVAAPVAEVASLASATPTADPQSDGLFNETPSGTDNAIFMAGLTYTFVDTDFGFSDTGNSPPDDFLAVQLTTLPVLGLLSYQGGAVVAGQSIPVADIIAGDLEFTVLGSEIVSYISFTFQVQDDGGLIDGGSDVDPTPNTMTMVFDSQDANFVHGLYLDVLNREPDVAGLEDWLDALDSGDTRAEVASGIWRSLEHRGIQVDGYYQLFFNRIADPAGRQNWINLLMNGAIEENVMAAFLVTNEFSFNYSTSVAFVSHAYQTILGRAAESAGLNNWVNLLDNGQFSRSQLAFAFVNTAERHQNLVTSYYQDFLDRQPDSLGFAYWVGLLNDDIFDDRDVAEGILSSIEYANIPR